MFQTTTAYDRMIKSGWTEAQYIVEVGKALFKQYGYDHSKTGIIALSMNAGKCSFSIIIEQDYLTNSSSWCHHTNKILEP